MNRFSRINTIWRKELIDTLRDRRTLIAMVLVPLVLYPAMMLGSLQGFELQVSRLRQERYTIGVLAEPVRAWLRHVIDTDAARQPGAEPGLAAEDIVEKESAGELQDEEPPPSERDTSPTEVAEADVRRQPPEFTIEVIADPNELVARLLAGTVHVGVILPKGLPHESDTGSVPIRLLMDQTEIRSQMATSGIEGVFDRYGAELLRRRLARIDRTPEFVNPLQLTEQTVATPEKVGGSILGQIVPLILIIMTITGAIYPAIDLTAGERERGTLETLMVAPVPTVDLIAGKFVVVALIGMISALLNLLAIGGTVYLGGLGELLSQGGQVVIPIRYLPWVLLVMIPLAVMFSALLLAVCSFARSFKEAQNYVMPVMVAALIPAVVGVLPGMRLEGPLLIMPVTNITILTRDLFTGRFDVSAILWVSLSTTLYAGAAVAVAAKLFGQEAVLFADSGSVKTIFQRRFLKWTDRPGAAQAFLLLAAVFSANFFAQQTLLNRPGVFGTIWFWYGLAGILVTLFVIVPLAAAAWSRVRVLPAFALRPAPWPAWIAALLFGLSTWILAQAWTVFQQGWLPIPTEMEQMMGRMVEQLSQTNLVVMLLFLAVLPGLCEELFFRGYALSGLRGPLGKTGAVVVTGLAFGVYHFSVHRLAVTAALGLLFGLLVVQYRSIWPAMLAHLLNNGLQVLASHENGLKPVLEQAGFASDGAGPPPALWIIGAAVLTLAGVAICMAVPAREDAAASSAEASGEPGEMRWPNGPPGER